MTSVYIRMDDHSLVPRPETYVWMTISTEPFLEEKNTANYLATWNIQLLLRFVAVFKSTITVCKHAFSHAYY